ncbi:phosphotransferase family protein [Yinghuangia seranimata]|uniref:phosphotransferase family protein n=1 Tax=Yinghuangia seranimata TaxID=408067 RepID=UPI00248B2E89|nr:phosphotransferase family protein [Yinghuangia seranimata]MDI2132653.1 phosphotransferase family protein [Yinghuangia seranimata]
MSESGRTVVPAGVAPGEVTEWLAARVPSLVPPLSFTPVVGGHSNLTYVVADGAGTRWVLRRPPLGHVLATAHDMGREHRILAALGSGRTPVPVPPVVGLSADDSVNGAPFYVMEFVDGAVLRNAADATRELDIHGRRRAGEQLADVLAAIHAVDVDAVGLGDLGRREDYIGRQLRRWHRQWEATRVPGVEGIDEVHAALSASVPEQQGATIVHGDFRLDNCIVGPDGSVRAVLDWELCTLGDPLADVGTTLVYWVERGEDGGLLPSDGTAAEGFVNRAAFCARYAAATGRDLSGIAWYAAFAYWRLACILAGVLDRYTAGAMGDQAGDGGASRFTREGLAGLAAKARTVLEEGKFVA